MIPVYVVKDIHIDIYDSIVKNISVANDSWGNPFGAIYRNWAEFCLGCSALCLKKDVDRKASFSENNPLDFIINFRGGFVIQENWSFLLLHRYHLWLQRLVWMWYVWRGSWPISVTFSWTSTTVASIDHYRRATAAKWLGTPVDCLVEISLSSTDMECQCEFLYRYVHLFVHFHLCSEAMGSSQTTRTPHVVDLSSTAHTRINNGRFARKKQRHCFALKVSPLRILFQQMLLR